MRRHLLELAAASALTAFSIATAFAHASLETPTAPAGSYKAVMRIPHGCDGQATHTVRIDIPEGFVGVKPMPKSGWTIDIEKGDYARSYDLHGERVSSGVKAVIWSGGALPDQHYDEFVVRGTLAGVEKGQKLYFDTLQRCAGAEVAWTGHPADGQDPHSLDHPAPMVTIAERTADGHGHAHGAAADDMPVVAGDLEISAAWAKAMLPGQPAGGGYLTITNTGDEPDRLTAVTSPAAGAVEVHKMEVVDDVMTMRPVDGGLEIPAGGTVELKPGGMHLMFMQVAEPFRDGGRVPVTLDFEKAGKVELTLPVTRAGGAMDHSSH
nr:DUF1775 domain-containing protein [Mesorhizobium xinjiangense]